MIRSSSRHRHERNLNYEARRQKRRRKDKKLLLAMVLVGLMLGLGVEIGRAFIYMRDVQRFAETIDKQSPAMVKEQLHEYAKGLGDHNPLIRSAAMAALKLATGWRLGTNPGEWRQHWNEHAATWQYHPETNAPPAAPAAAWEKLLPPTPTNSPPVNP